MSIKHLLIAFLLLIGGSCHNRAATIRLIGTYTILSCKGDCVTFVEDFPHQKGVSLTTDKGQLWIAHGNPDTTLSVPANHKMVSCYCNQEQCIVRTPKHPQYVVLIGRTISVYTY